MIIDIKTEKGNTEIKKFCINILTFQIFCLNIYLSQKFWKVGDRVKVYEKVRAYLERNGIKQKTVAQKADISITTFNAIMNGKRTMYAEDLKAVCLALNVSPELFVELSPTEK